MECDHPGPGHGQFPAAADLLATERKVEAIWRAIRLAEETGDWRPQRTKLCAWCSYKALCPEFGGTPPPYPGVPAAARPGPTTGNS